MQSSPIPKAEAEKTTQHSNRSNLEPIVCPRPKLHHASLFVEGKIFDVDLARGFIDGRRFPLDQPVVPQGCLRC